ncbi:MAG: sugar phosphate isomerase/epimerase family protein [Christensenellales bacterium]|jgi:sugar phosphate isomerase/epimerase
MSRAEILLSTGAFTGRINGRNHRLAIEYMNRLECDGFELMIFEDWLEKLDEIIAEYIRSGIRIKAVHSVKSIGDAVSDPDEENWLKCRRLYAENCRAAQRLGADKLVAHIWGRPHSDRYFDIIARRCGWMKETAEAFSLDFLPENCVCLSSPIENFERLAALIPGLGVTIDTRPAQFHRELERTTDSPVFKNNVRHIHINDFSGGYMQWDALYPIPALGSGQVNFPIFFAALRKMGYNQTITLESPRMRPDGVDYQGLNEGLAFIRQSIL